MLWLPSTRKPRQTAYNGESLGTQHPRRLTPGSLICLSSSPWKASSHSTRIWPPPPPSLFLSISWPSVPSSLSSGSPRFRLSKYLLCAKDWTLLLGSGECCLKHKRLSREQLYWLNIHFLPFCFCKSPWCCLWLTAPPAHLWPWIPLGNVTESCKTPYPLHSSPTPFMCIFKGKRKKEEM